MQISCSVNEEWFLSIGASIGYWQGDVTKLLEDVRLLFQHGPLGPLSLSRFMDLGDQGSRV